MKLNKHDEGIMFDDMIEDMALSTGKHIDIIINEMARHYGVKERYITDRLKLIQSDFANETNRVVGFIGGEPMKRTTYHMACKRIFEKLMKGYKGTEFDPTDQEHIRFLTESMYSYVKNNCDRTAPAEV